ncbi:MAG: TonB family protein [Acidobacteriota bacterium]
MIGPLFILKVERNIFTGLGPMVFISALGHIIFLSGALLLSSIMPGRTEPPEVFFKVSLASLPSFPEGSPGYAVKAGSAESKAEVPSLPAARKKEAIEIDARKTKKPVPEKKKAAGAEKAVSRETSKEGSPLMSSATAQAASGNPDASLSGSIGGNEKEITFTGGVDFEYAWYRATVISKLKENWVKPVIPLNGRTSLLCTITFQIMRDGRVEDIVVESSSGLFSLDRSALRAVQDSSPFPPLPYQFGQPSLKAKFIFDLKPE